MFMVTESLDFTKMHGLGNDFVIVEDWQCRLMRPGFDPRPLVQRLADRRLGVGADQVIVLQPPSTDLHPSNPKRQVRANMLIFNADGSSAKACGNGTRCVAWLLANRGQDKSAFWLESKHRLLRACVHSDDRVDVDMGEAHILWDHMPEEARASRPPYPANLNPIAVDVGNQHLVFFVPDVHEIDLALWGAVWEHWPYLQAPSNISVAQIAPDSTIFLRVWESGAGLTPACGSAACAAFAAAYHTGLLPQGMISVGVIQAGGELRISLNPETGYIEMEGPVAHVFDGQFTPAALAGVLDNVADQTPHYAHL
jgi:diaminopimelate epimerase